MMNPLKTFRVHSKITNTTIKFGIPEERYNAAFEPVVYFGKLCNYSIPIVWHHEDSFLLDTGDLLYCSYLCGTSTPREMARVIRHIRQVLDEARRVGSKRNVEAMKRFLSDTSDVLCDPSQGKEEGNV